MKTPYSVTDGRHFSKVEQMMIWQKPTSHQTSEEELRIASEIKENWNDPEMKIINVLLEGDAGSGKTQLAKALSFDLQLPYTKVTCFADMDKADVFGALLPVVVTDNEADGELLEAIYQTDRLNDVLDLIQRHYSISPEGAREKLAALIEQLDETDRQEPVHYKFYPSEIVRAIEKGYLLEIQEPTVIRDASVLVALNSVLENNGMLNIPTGLVRRHPDCVVVITTNRNYQGNRPLNESLRDRMQHAERMDLPTIEVMVERAQAKTGVTDQEFLNKMAQIIRLLDTTAKTNAIKGVAGMRSYFYWVNTLKQGQDPLVTIYPKVLYKLTTDPDELQILITALEDSGLLGELRTILTGKPLAEFKQKNRGRKISQSEADERNITNEAPTELIAPAVKTEGDVTAEESAEAEKTAKAPESREETAGIDGDNHEANEGTSQTGTETEQQTSGAKNTTVEKLTDETIDKKELNKNARELMKETIHAKAGLIIHRPEATDTSRKEARQLSGEVAPIVENLSKQISEILENEQASVYGKGKYTGTRFDASKVAYGDFRTFDKKNPPHEIPSLAVALRVDESGSMLRDQRMQAAKTAAIAVTEFAEKVGIALTVYGDTADISTREKTSLYSYKEFDEGFSQTAAKIATMKPRQNNRDGAVLKVLSQKLVEQTATTKLLINISDGQPKALPDYTGKKAQDDIQGVINEYERQGIIYLAAAIGEDKEKIKEIYGENRFLDISDLREFPKTLIQLISRYI